MTGQRVTVTVAPADFDAAVTALRAVGMSRMDVHRAIGIVTGDADDPAALVHVPGVLAVEPERRLGVPPPGAGIQ